MAQDATIITASLSDSELKNSIDNLVKYVDEGTKKMAQSFNVAVDSINKKISEIGSGGEAAKTSPLSNTTKKIKDDVKNITVAVDEMSSTINKKASGMSIMETYDMQIKLLIERLKDVRGDIDVFNAAIGSGKATQIEWGQQGLKQANAEAEKLMNAISTLEGKRDALSGIMRPQTHEIQNFVNSLVKVNPELESLNQQYKRGTALLQQKGVVLKQTAQEEKQAAQESAKAAQRISEYTAKRNVEEAERQKQILANGQEAQATARKLIAEMNEQMSSGDGVSVQTKKVYELLEALRQINGAYYSGNIDKKSDFAKSLENDKIAIYETVKAVTKYNNDIFAANRNGGNGLTQKSTIESLRKELSSLTAQYQRLSIAQLDAGRGDKIIQKFQEITRAAELMEKKLRTPINMEAIKKLDEGTLDNIQHKIQQLNIYRGSIDLTKEGAAQKIKEVDTEIERLQKDMNKYMATSKSVLDGNNALARSFNYMKNRLAFYFTVGASTSFVKELIEVRSQYEMNERALGILIDSAEKGSEIFRKLSDMALVSPYTLIELSNAARQLSAYGVAANDLYDTTRRLADMASAVGAPLERIAYTLGHIQSYGYLTSLQARQFANSGIPIVG